MQHVLFVLGLVLLVGVELLRWLADAPAETCTGLTAIAWLCIGGPPALSAVAARRNERGQGALGLLAALAVLALVPLLLSASAGCGSREVRAGPDDDPPWFHVKRGPPCIMSMHEGDGTLHGRITHPSKPCRVLIDEKELPPKPPPPDEGAGEVTP